MNKKVTQYFTVIAIALSGAIISGNTLAATTSDPDNAPSSNPIADAVPNPVSGLSYQDSVIIIQKAADDYLYLNITGDNSIISIAEPTQGFILIYRKEKNWATYDRIVSWQSIYENACDPEDLTSYSEVKECLNKARGKPVRFSMRSLFGDEQDDNGGYRFSKRSIERDIFTETGKSAEQLRDTLAYYGVHPGSLAYTKIKDLEDQANRARQKIEDAQEDIDPEYDPSEYSTGNPLVQGGSEGYFDEFTGVKFTPGMSQDQAATYCINDLIEQARTRGNTVDPNQTKTKCNAAAKKAINSFNSDDSTSSGAAEQPGNGFFPSPTPEGGSTSQGGEKSSGEDSPSFWFPTINLKKDHKDNASNKGQAANSFIQERTENDSNFSDEGVLQLPDPLPDVPVEIPTVAPADYSRLEEAAAEIGVDAGEFIGGSSSSKSSEENESEDVNWFPAVSKEKQESDK